MMANTIKPTATNLKKLPIPAKGMTQHTLASCFYMRVYASGKKVFYASYRRNGKFDMKKLGEFDGTKESIKAAEQAHASLKADVAENKTPAKLKRRKIDPQRTFSAMWHRYIETKAKTKNAATTIREKQSKIDADVMPHWADMHVADITEDKVFELRDYLQDQPSQRPKFEGEKRSARSVGLTIAHLRSFFSWLYKQRYIDKNPAERVEVFESEPRQRILKNWEVQNIWFACELLGYPQGVFFQLCLLTGQRRSLVLNARYSQDFDVGPDGKTHWLIHPQAVGNKAKQPFRLRVTPLLQRYLDKIPRTGSDYLFPAQGNDENPMSDSKLKKRLNNELDRYNKRVEKYGLAGKEPVEDWRLHDFRRLMNTTLAEAEHDHNAIQVLLGQKPPSKGGVSSHYNLATYTVKANKALEDWHNWLIENVISPNAEGAKILEQLNYGKYRKPSQNTTIHFGTRAFE